MSTNESTNPASNSRAKAPGKLILSGEHSVVYGAPALAIAVEHYTKVWFTPVSRTGGLRTAFEHLSKGQFYPFKLLSSFKKGLDKRFEAFKRGDLTVQKILERPDDLAIYAVASLLGYLPVPGIGAQHNLPMPGVVNSTTELPVGAGMGSSAAVIAATFVLFEHLMQHYHKPDRRFEQVRFCERLQHGHGSAIDAATVVYGGLHKVQQDLVTAIPLDSCPSIQNSDAWYWIVHGKPEVSTGECVSAVKALHGDDRQLWESFSDCTQALLDALSSNTDPSPAIKENHQLLNRIGVVPQETRMLISQLEQAGGAAKISGAGASKGRYGGLVLAYMPDQQAMNDLMQQHQDLRWEALRPAEQGAHLL